MVKPLRWGSPYPSPQKLPQRKPLATAITTVLAASSLAVAARAQDGVIEEVIVTATKRSEDIMDVPIAITAMSGEFLREVNLDDVKDLVAFTPGITGNTKDSFLDGISIRGIRTIDFGNGGDPSAAVYKNGFYQGRNGSAVSSLFDIERAEVLRGPQGFLFGRNAVGGAMNVITAKPDPGDPNSYVEVDVGERSHLVVEGAATVTSSDRFAVRLAAYHSEEDGYVGNIAGGEDLIAHDKSALRVSGKYTTDLLNVDAFFEYEDRQQTGTVYRVTGRGGSYTDVQARVNGGTPWQIPADGRDVNNDDSLGSRDNGQITTLGLRVDYELSNFTLTSLTAYKDHTYDYVEDFDGSPLILFNYGQDQEGDYFEQEVRLTSDTDGPLSWYAGASIYSEDIDTVFLGQQAEDAYCYAYWSDTCQGVFDYYNGIGNPDTLIYYFGADTWAPSPTGLINDRNRIAGKYSGYATYFDLSYEFSEAFDVNLGIRYSADEKEFSQLVLPDSGNSILANRVQTGFSTPTGALTADEDWNDVTYRLVGNFRPRPDTLIYASLTTGYKPGGFGSFNIEPGFDSALYGRYVASPAVDRPSEFGPETVDAFEVGYKGTLLNGRAQLSANAFAYTYEDLQATFDNGPIVIVDNIGEVDGRGVEIDLRTAITDNVSLQLGASWFDSEANNVQAFCSDGERVTGDINVCEGNSIPWAPEWTAFAVLRAALPAANGEWFGNLHWTWEDERRTDWAELDVVDQVLDGINQTDLLVGYRADAGWTVTAYAENLFDELWYDGGADGNSPTSPFAEYTFGPARPRTLGVRFGYRFD